MAARKRVITDADRRAAAKLRALWQQFRDRNPGISQEKAAASVDITQSALSQFLLGSVPIRVSPVLKLAKLFGVDPREIRDDLPELIHAGAREPSMVAEARASYRSDRKLKQPGEAEMMLALVRAFLETDDDGRRDLFQAARALGELRAPHRKGRRARGRG